MNVETVKVQPWGKGQGEFVEINKSDFDPKVHKPYEPTAPASTKKSSAAKGEPK